MWMKNSPGKICGFQDLLTTRLSLLVVCLLALPAGLPAIEDPPGCSLANGGLGNTSQGGINFNLDGQAHVGDTVPVFPSLGMVAGACRAINATGSVWIAVDAANSVRLTNFLDHVNLDPGVLIWCPVNALCRPGPYNLHYYRGDGRCGGHQSQRDCLGRCQIVRAVAKRRRERCWRETE